MNLEYPQDPEGLVYKRMRLYQSKRFYIIMGYSKYENEYKLLYINRSSNELNLESIIEEDKQRFASIEDAEASLRRREENPKAVQFLHKFYGIVGFFKFLKGFYAIIITEIQKIARLGRHKIWKISKTEVLSLFDQKNSKKEELHFKSQLCAYDMTEGFYGSYSYDLTNSLAKNMVRNAMDIADQETNFSKQRLLNRQFSSSKEIGNFSEIFTWNFYGLSQFYPIVHNKKWILPIIHGYIEQKSLKSLNFSFSITIISRRCRHHAGTRFCKRGINEEGFAANFVETEQIVIDLESTHRRPSCTSFIQVRGSAPVFWHQDPSILSVKPPIQLNQCDPYYSATKKHFGDLYARYGEKIFCMDLVKSIQTQTKEEVLAMKFSQVVEEINREIDSRNQITYFHFDMKKQLKTDKTEYVEKSYTYAYYVVHQVGTFQVQDSKRAKTEQCVEMQNGVLRSNCVDCLDRTNSFQQLIGEIALAIQLAKMFSSSLKFSELDVHEKVLTIFRGMFERTGDVISEQYGSSKAHKQNIKEQKTKWRFELFTSIERHFKNNLSDSARQQVMDLFLGNFIPDANQKTWQNPIKQFFPKDGFENLVFRTSTSTPVISSDMSMIIQPSDHNWWARSISFFIESYYINVIRQIQLEKSSMSNQETLEKNNQSLFKSYQLPLQNQRNKFSFKKFQIEFINLINKYDQQKFFCNSLSIKLVLALPKNYLQVNFMNSFQKISRKDITQKLGREYNKLIHLFPDQEIQNFARFTESMTMQEYPNNQDRIKNGSRTNTSSTVNQVQTDKASLSSSDQFSPNLQSGPQTMKPVNIVESDELDSQEERKSADNTMSLQAYSPPQIKQDAMEPEVKFQNNFMKGIEQQRHPLSAMEYAGQQLIEQPRNLTFASIANKKKEYVNFNDANISEKNLIDEYFAPTILPRANNITQEITQKKGKQGRYQSQPDSAAFKYEIEEYLSINGRTNARRTGEMVEGYLSYKDSVQFKQGAIANSISQYFDLDVKSQMQNQEKQQTQAQNNAQRNRCQACAAAAAAQDSNYKSEDRGRTYFFDAAPKNRAFTRFDFEGQQINAAAAGNERQTGGELKHHPKCPRRVNSARAQTRIASNFVAQMDQQGSQNSGELNSSFESENQFDSNSFFDGGQQKVKKNVLLLDMLIKRNFIFPSNTVINVV